MVSNVDSQAIIAKQKYHQLQMVQHCRQECLNIYCDYLSFIHTVVLMVTMVTQPLIPRVVAVAFHVNHVCVQVEHKATSNLLILVN